MLTRGGPYIKLPEQIAKKKTVMNLKNNAEQCLKWAGIAAIHHEEIVREYQHIAKLKHYEVQYFNTAGIYLSFH